MLRALHFDEISTAVIEDTSVLMPAQVNLPLTPASVVRYDADYLSLEIDARADGLLVLTDTFYPGWHVWVDGIEQPIVRTNFLFRGVVVRAGPHRVEFKFQPASFALGLTISLITIGLLLLAAAVHVSLSIFPVRLARRASARTSVTR